MNTEAMPEDDEAVLSELEALQHRLGVLREQLGLEKGSETELRLTWGERIAPDAEDFQEEFRNAARRAQFLSWRLDQRRLSRFMREAQAEEGLSDEMKAWWWHRY